MSRTQKLAELRRRKLLLDKAIAALEGARHRSGPHPGYEARSLEAKVLAFRRDVPGAEVHLLDAGHFALETRGEEIAALVRNFLGRVHAA